MDLTNKQGELYKEVEWVSEEWGRDRLRQVQCAGGDVRQGRKRLNSLADTECKAVTYESASSPDTTLEDEEKAGALTSVGAGGRGGILTSMGT